MKHAIGYIRRSSAGADSPGDASREAQEESIRRLAAAFAPDAKLDLLTDWGISGRRDDRPEYVRLKEAIATGGVCCVFSYSLSRLGRTARELDSLFSLCEQHGVQVITQADGTLTATSATGKFLRRILAELAELESELAKERSAAARAAKVERGDVFGHAPMGWRNVKNGEGVYCRVPDPERPVTPVLDAYREAGTVLGAVKLLNARGVPSPKGKRWGVSALHRIIETNAPELLPIRGASGKRVKSSAILSQLLLCHCGHVMTPNTHRKQYYCSHGHVTPGHGRYTASEAVLLPWVREEAGRLEVPWDEYQQAEQSQRLRELDERRGRIVEAFIDGLMARDERDRRLQDVDEELERLNAAGQAVEVAQAIDFDLDPALVNAALRALWRSVQLDENLRPVSADWVVPAWRATEP